MNKTQSWPYIDLKVSGAVLETALCLLWENGCTGVLEDTPEIDSCRVYFSDFASRDNAGTILRNALDESDLISIENGVVTDPGWRTAWHKYFKPAPVGTRFLILPSWEKADDCDRIPIIIDPGQAFGTGQHETTSLCITMMERFLPKNASVFDAGCGSGVLGIAAIKLGACSVAGCDVEVEAIEEARQNAVLNNVSTQCSWVCGDVTRQTGMYTYLLGNINIRFLTAHADSLLDRVNPGGLLVISGFLHIDRQAIEDTFTSSGSCILIDYETMGEWASAVFEKKQ